MWRETPLRLLSILSLFIFGPPCIFPLSGRSNPSSPQGADRSFPSPFPPSTRSNHYHYAPLSPREEVGGGRREGGGVSLPPSISLKSARLQRDRSVHASDQVLSGRPNRPRLHSSWISNWSASIMQIKTLSSTTISSSSGGPTTSGIKSASSCASAAALANAVADLAITPKRYSNHLLPTYRSS